MELEMKSGQILIIVLLVVVVVLAVGLSVASRNITNLRTSTQTEQSQRAFTAAEGGVEDVLSQLDELAADPAILSESGKNFPISIGESGIEAQVNVKASDIYESTISLGNVGQINLEGVPAGSQIQIEWAKSDGLESDNAFGGPASIEATQVFGNGSEQERYYFLGIEGRPNESGDFNTSTCSPSAEFSKCALITARDNAKILRIKPFWAPTTVRVQGIGNALPVQTYDVTSTASTEIGVTRKIQVSRNALPQLPAIFDFVLYSEQDIVK